MNTLGDAHLLVVDGRLDMDGQVTERDSGTGHQLLQLVIRPAGHA